MSEEENNNLVVEKKYRLLGIWSLPPFFQKFHNTKGFMFFYSFLALIILAITEGVFVVNPPELEARFGLSKSDSAFIGSGVNIGFCALIFFVSYFGEKYNKAKCVAIGSLLFGLGCFLYSLPHFTTPLHVIANETDRFHVKCKPWRSPSCEVNNELRYTIYILFAGQLLIGASLTPFYSLGFTYIQQNIPKRSTSLYFGHLYSCMNLGATIGILGGGSLVRKLYVDFDKTNKIPPLAAALDDSKFVDSRWVGAWWLFPLVAVGVSWLLFVIFLGFSSKLPGAVQDHENKQSEIYDYGNSKKANKTFDLSSLKSLLQALIHLISNPTFMTLVLAGCLQNLVVFGSGDIIAKYFEMAFNMNSENSGLISGFFFAFGGILGSFVGGILVYLFRWKVKQILKFCACAMLLAAIASPGYLLYCENIQLAGVTVEYGGSQVPNAVNLTSSCNQHCYCQEEVYVPACGSDNVTYFTPCQAGCNRVVAEYTYGSCDCVSENQKNFVDFQPSRTVVDSCPTNCKYTPYTIAFIFFIMFSLGLLFSPFLVIPVRIVPTPLKSLSLGFQGFLYRCLGIIPSSEIFELVLTPACLLWSKNACTGKQGKCLFYNNKNMAIGVMLITMIGSLIASAFILVSMYFYKPVSPADKHEKEENHSVSDDSCISDETAVTTKL